MASTLPETSIPAMDSSELDSAVADLCDGANVLLGLSLEERIAHIDQSIEGVGEVAEIWVEAACQAKRIPQDSTARAEEILTGPLSTIRFLQLVKHTLQDLAKHSIPQLPDTAKCVSGQWRVPVFPTKWLYDAVFFRPMSAETWLCRDVGQDELFSPELIAEKGDASFDAQRVTVVLGAGNVSSIPATDALTKILIERTAVVLKMNPVNEYLGEIFEKAFRCFVDAKMLRIAYGGTEVGKYLVQHSRTNSVHITGSIQSHDAIVWGSDDQQNDRRAANEPLLRKEITSELSNVSPWAIVPADYSRTQLRAQAESVAASITNNASFNCIATKVILTSRSWAQRDEFLQLVEDAFQRTPRRHAYYPGAAERYEKFAGTELNDRDKLPWKLMRDVDPDKRPILFAEESFTCVCAEVALDSHSAVEFLASATEMMNERIWGTLAATITVHPDFQRKHRAELESAIADLRYGTIGINQWPALAFAWMSPPWGGHPSSTLQNAESGVGFVHNTFMLNRPEKTVLRAPLSLSPKPVWFSTHRHPERVAWRLLDFYRNPSVFKIPGILFAVATG